jgi:hypothetical protein
MDFGDGRGMAKMVIFELHHIVIETLIGRIGVVVWIFFFQMASQFPTVDEVLHL